MKKILAILMTALLAFGSMGALAEEPVTLGGLVLEVTEESILINTAEFGDVKVLYDHTTELEGISGGIKVGTYVIVTYDGVMTKSLPPQIYAKKIAMYVVRGTVAEVTESGVLVEQFEDKGQIIVHLPEGFAPLFVGSPVDVYFDGIMLLSYPGQIGALHVYTPTLTGAVAELGDGFFLLTDADGAQYRVNTGAETIAEAEVAVGAGVTVYFNGAMTYSLPGQLFAIAVVHAGE